MSIQLVPNELVHVTSIDETQKNLGQLVRISRQALDLTQARLGARSGLKQSAICMFEQKGVMTFDLFIRASRGLELPPWALLKVAEDPDAFEEACSVKSRFVSSY